MMSAWNYGHPRDAKATPTYHLSGSGVPSFVILPSLSLLHISAMSFNHLNNLEAQTPASDGQRLGLRRDEDPQYRDDPEFDRLTETLSNQLFTLTSNISRLSSQIALLGTKRDNERVRERVHDLLEETRSGFKDVGDGIKKAQAWEDVNVSLLSCSMLCWLQYISDYDSTSPPRNGRNRSSLPSLELPWRSFRLSSVALLRSKGHLQLLPVQHWMILSIQEPMLKPISTNSNCWKSSNRVSQTNKR